VSAVLGIDAGSVRVGLAVSDETRSIATPVATLARTPASELQNRIEAEVQTRGADRIVVGLPRRLNGSEGTAAEDARALAEDLRGHTGVPVEMWDEWFTTAQAERALISGGVRRGRRKQIIDSLAASLMLQSWLDAQRVRR
jgi:putative Holliday junction resolvase